MGERSAYVHSALHGGFLQFQIRSDSQKETDYTPFSRKSPNKHLPKEVLTITVSTQAARQLEEPSVRA